MIDNTAPTETQISSAIKSFLSAAGVISNMDDCEYVFEETGQGVRFTIVIPDSSVYKGLSTTIFNAFSKAASPFYKKGTIAGFTSLQNAFRIIAAGTNAENSATAILGLIQAAREAYFQGTPPSLDPTN